ncbi:MAG TPA: APC family permease [Rubrobacteraceae bacterium]|nr:APC family permease [Rubrobacteraceae bacterium]
MSNVRRHSAGAAAPARRGLGLLAAVSIGVGGMIGAGIFSILGVVAGVSGTALPVSFVIGGVVAILSAYSYVKLGIRYPSVGGASQFLVEEFGDGLFSGALNIFQYFAYIIAIALYAHGFAGYAMTFFPSDTPGWIEEALAVGIVVLFALVNFLGSRIMGRAETVIVAIKVGVLVLFTAAGIFFVEPDRLAPSGWGEPQNLLFGAGVLFIGYEGFGLITNAAGEMTNPRRELPRAIYLATAIVIAIYVLVAVVVIGNLSLLALKAAEDSALAEAARPFLGQFGFTLIAIAALLSTSSAVNATLFGAANVSYQVAKDGELPQSFTRKVWSRNSEGLFITAGLVIVFVALFDLEPIAMMGSAAFLIVYTAVSFGHLRVHQETGARPLIIWASLVTLLIMFVLLTVYILNNQPAAALALVVTTIVSVLVEWAYRRWTGRRLHRLAEAPGEEDPPEGGQSPRRRR